MTINLMANGLLPLPDEITIRDLAALMGAFGKAGRVTPIEDYCPWMAGNAMKEAMRGLV